MSVDKKLQVQKYHLRPRRKSSGNVAQTIVTVHEGHLVDSGDINDTPNMDTERLPSKFVHSLQNGRMPHTTTRLNNHQYDAISKCDEVSLSSSSSFAFDDVFLDLPSVNGEHSSRPVALEEELQGRVQQLSGLLSVWKKRCQEQKQSHTSLLQQLQTTQAEYSSLMEHTKEKYHKKVSSLRAELNRVTTMKEKIEKEHKEMQTSFRASLEKNKKDMETLHLRWKQRNSEIEKLRELHMQSRNELSTYQTQVDRLKSENKVLSVKNKELFHELEKREVKNNNTTCSCMGQEYRLLFELSLSKIKTFESKQTTEMYTGNSKHNFKTGEEALSHIEKDLENMAQRNMEVNKVQYFSDSFDSCDSLRSPPASPDLNLNAKKDEKAKRVQHRKSSESALTTHKRNNFSVADSSSTNSVFSSFGNIATGHVTHPLDMQRPRDHSHGLYRKRAFSEIKHNVKHYPMGRSHTTDDSQMSDFTSQNPGFTNANQNEIAKTNNDLEQVEKPLAVVKPLDNNTIPLEICSDSDIVPSDHETTQNDGTTSHVNTSSGFGGLRSRRNGITGMPLDVSVQLRMNDVKKSKDFSELLKKFTKDKEPASAEKKFSAIKRISRKKSKSTKE